VAARKSIGMWSGRRAMSCDGIRFWQTKWYEASELDGEVIEEAELFVKVLLRDVYDGILIHRLPKLETDGDVHLRVDDRLVEVHLPGRLLSFLKLWSGFTDRRRTSRRLRVLEEWALTMADIDKDLDRTFINGRPVSEMTSMELWAELRRTPPQRYRN